MNLSISQQVTTALEPKRNVVAFNGISIPLTICNDHIKTVYNYLINTIPDIFTFSTTTELRANHLNYSLRITCNISQISVERILTILLSVHKCAIPLVYLEFLDTRTKFKQIPVNKFYKCKYDIYYNPLSFRQPDDTIRDKLEEYIKEIAVNYENFCFIGGECVLFSKIIEKNNGYRYKNAHFFTDMESIYMDMQTNIVINQKNIKAALINYNKFELANCVNGFFADMRYCTIINTSKYGIGAHLAKELCKSLTTRIIIVSCNCKSLDIDIDSLFEGGYTVKSHRIIHTNYEVSFTILE
jgi:hypothetical protein